MGEKEDHTKESEGTSKKKQKDTDSKVGDFNDEEVVNKAVF